MAAMPLVTTTVLSKISTGVWWSCMTRAAARSMVSQSPCSSSQCSIPGSPSPGETYPSGPISLEIPYRWIKYLIHGDGVYPGGGSRNDIIYHLGIVVFGHTSPDRSWFDLSCSGIQVFNCRHPFDLQSTETLAISEADETLLTLTTVYSIWLISSTCRIWAICDSVAHPFRNDASSHILCNVSRIDQGCDQVDSSVQDCSISIALAMEILQSCTKLSKCFYPNVEVLHVTQDECLIMISGLLTYCNWFVVFRLHQRRITSLAL